MSKKPKNLLINNLGLKLLSVIFALILWLVVVNIDDPDKTRTFTTNVTLVNEQVLTDMGKSYEITDNSNVVTFRVTASRSIIERMTASDFKATADMTSIELKEDGTAVVPIDIMANRYSSQIDIDRKNKNLELTVEDLQSNQFKITAKTDGTPAEGSAVGEVTVSPDIISVSGPASVVGKIAGVEAVLDVSGKFEDVEDNVVPVLYDKNGNVLDTSKLTFNLETVNVKAEILSVKEIPISCETGGELGDDYQQVSVECAPEKITVKGVAEKLNKITVITIPKEDLDISGAKETLTKEVDISTYLPEGVTLVDSEQAKIKITIVIEKTETKTFNVPVENIKIFNLSDDYDIEYQGSKIPVTLKGYTSDMESLSASDIMLSIDVGQIKPGTSEVALALNLGSEYKLVENSTITINLIEKNTKEDTAQDESEKEE